MVAMKDKVGAAVLVAVALVFAFILLYCADARAQVTVEFKLLPPGELGVVSGEKHRVYTFDEWLVLAEFDAELVKLRADAADYKAVVEKLEAIAKKKDEQIVTLDKDKDILSKRSLRLDEELDKCEEEKIELAGGPIWPYIVGAVGSVVGIVGITMWAVESGRPN
jgi:hypothetical protein